MHPKPYAAVWRGPLSLLQKLNCWPTAMASPLGRELAPDDDNSQATLLPPCQNDKVRTKNVVHLVDKAKLLVPDWHGF